MKNTKKTNITINDRWEFNIGKGEAIYHSTNYVGKRKDVPLYIFKIQNKLNTPNLTLSELNYIINNLNEEINQNDYTDLICRKLRKIRANTI